MLAPQTIDPNDAIIVFSNLDVISENASNYQKTMGEDLGYSSLKVNVSLLDMTTNSVHVKSNLTMSYKTSANVWALKILDISTNDSGNPMLTNGHKYTGMISSAAGNPSGSMMREFAVLEFTVDDKGLEKTLMTQGYELDFSNALDPKFVWRDNQGNPTYTAKAYTGGTGTTPATSPADVTHRGPIVKFN
jgi:hypothetical protein